MTKTNRAGNDTTKRSQRHSRWNESAARRYWAAAYKKTTEELIKRWYNSWATGARDSTIARRKAFTGAELDARLVRCPRDWAVPAVIPEEDERALLQIHRSYERIRRLPLDEAASEASDLFELVRHNAGLGFEIMALRWIAEGAAILEASALRADHSRAAKATEMQRVIGIPAGEEGRAP